MDKVKKKAFERLLQLREEVEKIDPSWQSSGKFDVWQGNVVTALVKLFEEESRHTLDFAGVRYSPSIVTGDMTDSEWAKFFMIGVKSAKAIIDTSIQEIRDYELDQEHDKVDDLETRGSIKTDTGIFIVHGHDNEVKETVARFLMQLDLRPIILHEEPDGGRTLIEKFERRANTGYAIVLLTPDDVGEEASKQNSLDPRARQNVIFELGYFVGKLGRSRVCSIVKSKVDLPSNWSGIVYVPFEGEEWKIRIVRELKHAGFEIDANKAF